MGADKGRKSLENRLQPTEQGHRGSAGDPRHDRIDSSIRTGARNGDLHVDGMIAASLAGVGLSVSANSVASAETTPATVASDAEAAISLPLSPTTVATASTDAQTDAADLVAQVDIQPVEVSLSVSDIVTPPHDIAGFAAPLGESPFTEVVAAPQAVREVQATKIAAGVTAAPIQAGPDLAADEIDAAKNVDTPKRPTILDPVLGEGGVVDAVLGGGSILAPVTEALAPVADVLAPVLGEDGVVGEVLETVTAVLDPVLGEGGVVDAVLGGGSILAPVTEALAPVADVLAPVLGEDGVVGEVLETVTAVLDPVLGEGDVVDAVLGGGSILVPVTEALAPVADVLAPVLGEDGVVGETDDGGFLDGLLDGGFGEIEGLDTNSLMDMLLSGTPALGEPLADDGLLASILDVPELTGSLATEGLLDFVGGNDAADADVDGLLNEILDSGDRALDGVTDPIDAILEPVGAEALVGGLLDDAAVDNVLGVLFGEDSAPEVDGGVVDGLRGLFAGLDVDND